ncbi:hypothetical protein CCMSSC00406_0005341 [Pleurotus cornucopiae]|uniref:Uncharacterized protein n=1 Tax=Pleurotus cornucopiae TaxID=5321 RepID=A0ACB7IMJ8_PLECO|nr:hypothetical protein CCMSSC00406_0005341 [Pleurotus cornucopiae]
MVWPTTSLEFLGIEVDTVAMEARLPDDKLSYLCHLLATWTTKKSCILTELQELTGFLFFASQVIPYSQAFLCRLIDFSKTFSSPHTKRHIPSYAHRDIHWWTCYTFTWNGVSFIDKEPSGVIDVFTDASGTKGLGGVWDAKWFSSHVPRRYRNTLINFKELYAILKVILCWGHLWSGQRVIFHVDNTNVYAALNDHTTRSPPLALLLQPVLMLAASLRFSLSSVWLSSADNAIAHSLASSTRKTYSTGQKSFIDFIHLNSQYLNADRSILPASQTAILEWVSWLGDRCNVQPKTIKAYLSTVCSLHVDADLPFDACEAPVVQHLIRGIKWYHGERDRKPKCPITLEILRRIVNFDPGQSVPDLTFRAAATLAFTAFLRCGEFTVNGNAEFDPSVHLTRGSVEFKPSFENPEFLILTLPSSKTDPFRKGVPIFVAAAPGSVTCPVSALKALISRDPRSPKEPLFSHYHDGPLTRQLFIGTLHTHLLTAGYDAKAFSGHSFRRGAATAAAAAGLADHEIQQLGCWRSDAYKLYIDTPRERLINLSFRLHWASLPAQHFEPPALRFPPSMA